MKCQNCGAENPDSKKFCGDCGEPLSPPEAVRPAPAINPLTSNVYFFGRKIPPLIAIVGILCICLCFGAVLLSPSKTVPQTKTPQIAARSSDASTATGALQVAETPGPTITRLPTIVQTSSTATVPPTNTPVPPQVLAKQTVNVREGPGTQYTVLGKLQSNTSAVIIGKSEDGQWLQIAFPDPATPGWVSASVVTVNGSSDSLRVVIVVKSPTPQGVTAAKVPSPSSIPRLSENEYATEVAGIATAFSDALDRLSTLMADASDDPTLMLDNQWRTDAATFMALIKVVLWESP